MEEYIAAFVFFFAVIDPVGTVPVFTAVTARFDEKERRKIAFQATFAAAGILVFFIVAGELILTAIDIPLPAFQIAGGLVLFLFALTMIFGESKPEEELKLTVDGTETAIFPLAIPSIASPGAMLAAVLLTDNSKFSFLEQAQTTLAMLLVLVVVLVLMLLAGHVLRIIGNSGASIISRVMGLILTAVAVANVLEGIKVYFGI